MLKIIRKADVILLIILLISGLALTYYVTSTQKAGSEVVVSANGKPYGTYSLSKDRTIVVDDGTHINKITIKNGKVQMASANCKNQLCVHHSPIGLTNESIVCLPNRLMIEIKGEDGEFDAVAN